MMVFCWVSYVDCITLNLWQVGQDEANSLAWIPLQIFKDFEANISNANLHAIESGLRHFGMWSLFHVNHDLLGMGIWLTIKTMTNPKMSIWTK